MRFRSARFAAAAVALGLVLAACGDDNDDADTAAATQQTQAPATSTTAPAASDGETDIVDTAVAAGSFPTLVKAVQAAELVDTLKGDGPFTVFAPNEEAFKALPAGTLDRLLADPKGSLAPILTYHVVKGNVAASDVAGLNGKPVTTVNGASFTVTVDPNGAVMLTDGGGKKVNVVRTDIRTSNGIIHVIDGVMLPS